MKFKTINTIICSATMSVITVSAIFLAEIIGIANELFRLPYLLVVAVIYAAMLLSESKKQLLLKWVLSLPFSFFCFEYFWQTHYSIRALLDNRGIWNTICRRQFFRFYSSYSFASPLLCRHDICIF